MFAVMRTRIFITLNIVLLVANAAMAVIQHSLSLFVVSLFSIAFLDLLLAFAGSQALKRRRSEGQR
jgi:hypothetical protein